MAKLLYFFEWKGVHASAKFVNGWDRYWERRVLFDYSLSFFGKNIQVDNPCESVLFIYLKKCGKVVFSGEAGMVFKGNIGPWYNPDTKEFHISGEDARDLLTQSLEAFRAKSDTSSYPDEVFIHSKTYFDDEEWDGFCQAVNGKSKPLGIRIRNDNTFKLFRDFSYCIPRGSALLVTDTTAFLWTKGFITRIQTQLGLETPNPLSVEVTRGTKDIETVCKDILALTKLNYNSCIFGDGLPVTLRFADST